MAAHKELCKTHPDLLLIISPNTPERGTAVVQHIADAGIKYTRRSRGDLPSKSAYLADRLGDLGNWYALTDIVFLGGSLRPIGGQNPFDVAQSGATVLSGNHIFNFAETFSAMEAAGAARIVSDKADMVAQIDILLRDTASREKAVKAAHAFATQEVEKLDTIAPRLIKALRLA